MLWDKVAWIYDPFIHVINRRACAGLKRLMASVVKAEDEVLECACGTGLITRAMAPRCKRLVATDYSPKMLEQIRRRLAECSNVTFCQADILDLDFRGGSFDVVVAGNVIHLLDEPGKALDELLRVCRSGGRVIIPTYINRNAQGRRLLIIRLLERFGVDFKTCFTLESYKAFFARQGYPEVSCSLVEGSISCAVAVITKK